MPEHQPPSGAPPTGVSSSVPPADVPSSVPSCEAPRVTVVGMGADGWDGLTDRARQLLADATVVLGGRRQLALLPDLPAQRRVSWPSPLRAALPALLTTLPTDGVVALASGDPLVSGVGSTLIDLVGPERVSVEPAVSSVALARARMRWPAETCEVVTVVGRDVHAVLRQLAPGRRVIVLSSDASTPSVVAGLLVGAGYGDSRMVVLGDLGSDAESRLEARATAWVSAPPSEVPALHVLALELAGPPRGGWVAGLPDDLFEHDGQLTKRDLRASALARLAPTPGQHLWDVGAGAGSIGIEWMRAHPSCTATAVEADPARAERVGRNAASLGVPGLEVVTGAAPQALHGLRAPDAIFVGGGATRAGVIDTCLSVLGTSGRLVVHGVTLETETLLAELYRTHGGELTRIAVETTGPIGSLTGWAPARTVTQWVLAR